MSRIGKKPILVPDKVKVKIDSGKIFVEGPKGKLDFAIPREVEVKVEGNEIIVKKINDDKKTNAFQGMVRSSINNLVQGVNEGYVKTLEIQGVGYKAQSQGKVINLQLGLSHPVTYNIPEGITVKTPKPIRIVIEGIEKAKVGEVAAEIRDYLKPEPYKGKGIRYEGEYVRKKAGKSVA